MAHITLITCTSHGSRKCVVFESIRWRVGENKGFMRGFRGERVATVSAVLTVGSS
jgi:hypothetical protein